MWVHRLRLIAFWLLAIPRFVYFHGESSSETVLALSLMAIYFGLMAAHRLAHEAEIKFKPIPLLVIYIFTMIGPFVSIWLDRKAAAELSERGVSPGFLHFVRA